MAFMINRQAPQSGLANLLALRGRQGDTELVHMTKPEVAALQSMGQLTVNPSTGLPEAFKLKDILPTLVATGANIATGGALTPLQMALAAGGTSLLANKGDLGKAAMDGLMAFGGAKLGQMLGGAQEVAADAATQTASQTATQATTGVAPGGSTLASNVTAQATSPQGMQLFGGAKPTTTAPFGTSAFGTPLPQPTVAPTMKPSFVGQAFGSTTPTGLESNIAAKVAAQEAGTAIPKLATGEAAKVAAVESGLPATLYASGAMDVPKPPATPERQTPVVLEGREEQKIGVSPEGGYSQEDIEKAFIQDQYGTPIDPLKFFEYKSTPAVFGYAKAGGPMEDATKYHGPGMASGMVRGSGNGDGMSDDLIFEVKGGGEINKAALSEDEYIVDAFTVSALGNGSSDAGAKILDEFREEIRRKAYGKKKQPNQIDGRKIASSYA
jgi:hypothetical protein